VNKKTGENVEDRESNFLDLIDYENKLCKESGGRPLPSRMAQKKRDEDGDLEDED